MAPLTVLRLIFGKKSFILERVGKLMMQKSPDQVSEKSMLDDLVIKLWLK